jgi:hypothetical protein
MMKKNIFLISVLSVLTTVTSFAAPRNDSEDATVPTKAPVNSACADFTGGWKNICAETVYRSDGSRDENPVELVFQLSQTDCESISINGKSFVLGAKPTVVETDEVQGAKNVHIVKSTQIQRADTSEGSGHPENYLKLTESETRYPVTNGKYDISGVTNLQGDMTFFRNAAGVFFGYWHTRSDAATGAFESSYLNCQLKPN